MHTFQRHKVRPRETHSTTRLHRAHRPGNTVLLSDLYIILPSLVLLLFVIVSHQCISDRTVSPGTTPYIQHSCPRPCRYRFVCYWPTQCLCKHVARINTAVRRKREALTPYERASSHILQVR